MQERVANWILVRIGCSVHMHLSIAQTELADLINWFPSRLAFLITLVKVKIM